MVAVRSLTTWVVLGVVAAALSAAVIGAEVSDQVGTIPPDGKVMAGDHEAEFKCIVNLTNDAAASKEVADEDVEFKWYYLGHADGNGSSSEITEPKASTAAHGHSIISTLKLRENIRYGRYKCQYIGKSEGHFTLEPSFKLEKFEKSTTIMQGEDLMLHCKLKQKTLKENNSTVKFEWFRKEEDAKPEDQGKPITSEPLPGEVEPHFRIIATDDPFQSVLKIENTRYDDRGYYRCQATNTLNQASDSQTLVRVKDKYAPLYPFIGIVVEVIVLLTVIFICERRKGKDVVMEEDEDEGQNGTAAGAGSSNVRQRRT